MIFAGIVAGGKGTRMKNAPLPKQFLEIGDMPIIIKTVKAFYELDEIDIIYIGINSEWKAYAVELTEKFFGKTSRIRILDGGKDRNETVLNIANQIRSDFGANKGDIILTHDAVRPFVTKEIIKANIEGAKKFRAVGTYIPSVDTVVNSADGNVVESNLDRSKLFNAQTPQSFDVGALFECLTKLDSQTISALTDTCGIFTACGVDIHIISGSPENFKITTDYDLQIARLICQR